jgi:hypothetical protein
VTSRSQSRSDLFGALFVLLLCSPPPFSLRSHIFFDVAAAHMIRRTPTLIPLSDLEIQDIRDMYNKQKAEREKQEELLRKIKMFTQNPELLKEDPQMLEYLNKNLVAKQKDKKQEDKAKRLGLDESKLTLIFIQPHRASDQF